MNQKKGMTWMPLLLLTTIIITGFIYFKSQKPSLIHNIQEPALQEKITTTQTDESQKPKNAVCEICNPDDFVNIKASLNPVVVKFYATWCGPCNNLTPVFEKVAETFSGTIDFYSVNVDKKELVEAAQNAGLTKEPIVYLPTIVFYKKDSVHEQITGGLSETDLNEKIKSTFNL